MRYLLRLLSISATLKLEPGTSISSDAQNRTVLTNVYLVMRQIKVAAGKKPAMVVRAEAGATAKKKATAVNVEVATEDKTTTSVHQAMIGTAKMTEEMTAETTAATMGTTSSSHLALTNVLQADDLKVEAETSMMTAS